ncbi:ABC transporter substrate-binding protein [Parafrankia colletiae]|uniref:ABC transporter substrate-binding protein n=1 Tax=Parafrankia colletiae TaxID=573497 RepID=A0A1S1RDF4_9ACTN|nr:ABC transporter substrate-binding protein [Parafrankia colletiae]
MVGGAASILTLSEPRSLDPAALGNAYATTGLLGNALYGTLMTDDESGEVRYSMAESFTSTDGGATFTLKLRPELRFSDGTPLDAEAVKFNWDRIKDPATGSVNLAEASMIASSEIVDGVTLQVTMAAPAPRYAYSLLASTMNWIASPEALRAGKEAFDRSPVGAGPYRLERWTRQATMDLVRNERYWDAPKPYLDRLTLRAVSDGSQRYNTVLSGGADLAVEGNWANIDKARQAGLPTDVMELGGGVFVAMNTRRAPFDDVRARQAVAAALDLEALNLAVYNGVALPARTLFGESSPFYSDTALQTTDSEKAQRLFDELAREGRPVSFTFTSSPGTENRAIAENIQAQLSSYDNVSVKIKIAEIAELISLRTSHDFDATVSSTFFRDPEPRLSPAFSGDTPANVSGIADQQLTQALDEGRSAPTQEDRRDAYDRVQQRLTALTPVIFTARAAPGVISARDVGGVQQYGLGSLLPEELWIQK